ncbi:DUF397 domain-containing protein [Actinopolymorpha rutila]|uniref:DUF397 domain-containing protein n=1 Tax=Actinopolymorpha rutila TaxID=446787 RepID=A0A852ZPL4_9ACTN|nr:hypothetical protein [Actinopolymorpha rutila]
MSEQFSGWKKASYSNNGGNCVEVGTSAARVGVRDTKDRNRGVLAVSPAAWVAFVGDVKAGKYDLPR